MSRLLEVTGLRARYGKIDALHGVDFHVERGEIVTLIGANGAGKTTTLMAISRARPPDGPRVKAGDIRHQGQSILGLAPEKVVSELNMALTPTGRRIFGNLTVGENLSLATYARRDDKAGIKRDYQRVYDLFPRLAERRRQRSESLSGGEQQMLAVGRALMSRCSFLLLDEPSMGLAPLLVQDMFRALQALNREGMTILLVEQNAKLALKFAHRGYVLSTGEIVASGPCAQLMDDPEVKKAYLGG
ncbi:ABC transporter related protein [Desulfarculus baarsii DSM 2075]|uniref:ABC transporter related protein n=1 Tax=Desulfarculus baarsii (strain ATCC 33931 / DSM 2075 / LMG 7858 / VKM B-1802 / 2st14) TaxID=644282 RepID=E1QGI2_DESB2|nr:ABC transporter ATP-binding protein [Desulfarculus baarsii]ADK84675.1 ABC transporter related protein [Desulfarculus baarsii DSM 2075]